MKITAAVMREPNQAFSIEELDLDGPRAGEILVRVAAVGLCHSDILAAQQVLPVTMPVVLGHEGAGVVEAVGAGVTKVAVGDHVVMTFNSCGHCDMCGKGQPAYCRNFYPLNYAPTRPDGSHTLCCRGEHVSGNFFGQSSFASRALGTERNVVKVDKAIPLEIAAPFGCGIQTGAGTVMRALRAAPGSSIVVFGGGPVGLSAVMGAVIQGCGTIIMVEPVVSRQMLALELGATHVIDPKAGDVVAAIEALVPGGADYAVESSGAAAVFEFAARALGHRGTLALVGVPSSAEATIPLSVINTLAKGQTITGVIEGDSLPDDFIPELVALHRAGRFPVDKMIKTYPFSDINAAIEDQKRGVCVKVVLTL